MSGYQRVIICGNVGKDPEIKSFSNGGNIANFSIATSESWKDKQTGEKKEKVQWHNISVRNDHLIGVVESYVRKGGTVLIEGQLETRDYEKDGIKRYVTEIIIKPFNGSLTLMGSKKGGSGETAAQAEPVAAAPAQGGFVDDEIPFAWATILATSMALLGVFAGVA